MRTTERRFMFEHNCYGPEIGRPPQTGTGLIGTAMFKQPAENTNATPDEEKRSVERINRESNPEDEHIEIEAEARRLASERGGWEAFSQDEWEHAARIVHNRKISLSKA